MIFLAKTNETVSVLELDYLVFLKCCLCVPALSRSLTLS